MSGNAAVPAAVSQCLRPAFSSGIRARGRLEALRNGGPEACASVPGMGLN